MDDAVVIGSGPNGLVAANHLADAGWSVVVLEGASEPGGAVRSGELTVPGFRHDLFSAFYPLAVASPAIAGLTLEAYGLEWRHAPLVLAHPLPDGRCATLSRELDRTCQNVSRFASADGESWRRMIDDWDRIAEPVIHALLTPFPPVKAAARLAGRLGAMDALRLLRHALLPVRRMARERFAGEGAALLLSGLALHADFAPEAAGSGVYGWLLSCLGQRFGFPVPGGGAGALTNALVRRLESKGGRVVCSAPVSEVVVRRRRAIGVRLRSGDTVDAGRAVLADVSAPALYLELVGRDHLPPSFSDDLGRFEWDTATVKVDWALNRPIPWTAPDARQAGTVHVADNLNNLTESAAHLAMGLLPARPFLLMGQQAKADPGRSPQGTETAWAYTHVPRWVGGDALGALPVVEPGEESGWLEGFVERIESRVEALAPGFRSSILGRHCFSPSDLEAADPNLSGGAIGGGTVQIHQQLVFRPVPGWGRPETPITRLYLASASAHPGGGVHGAPGANAARAALAGFAAARSAVFGRGRGGAGAMGHANHG